MIPHQRLGFVLRTTLLATVLCSISPRGHAATDFSAIITPAAAGEQVVRTSLPLLPGWLKEGHALIADDGHHRTPVAFRVVSWHPSENRGMRSARRALVTFPYLFKTTAPVQFVFRVGKAEGERGDKFSIEAVFNRGDLTLIWKDGHRVDLRLLAPQRTSTNAPRLEIVEDNQYFRWQRLHLDDPQWPRMIEVRLDALGGVVVVAHLQRTVADDGRALDFGWELHALSAKTTLQTPQGIQEIAGTLRKHAFTNEDNVALQLFGGRLAVYHPTAPFKRRGYAEARFAEGERLNYRYLRCTVNELVPMQPESWQRAEVVIAPASLAHLTPTLLSPHRVLVDAKNWDALYDISGGTSGKKLPEELQGIVRYHRDAIVRSMAVGDDCGNVTNYSDVDQHGGVFGMNREPLRADFRGGLAQR